MTRQTLSSSFLTLLTCNAVVLRLLSFPLVLQRQALLNSCRARPRPQLSSFQSPLPSNFSLYRQLQPSKMVLTLLAFRRMTQYIVKCRRPSLSSSLLSQTIVRTNLCLNLLLALPLPRRSVSSLCLQPTRPICLSSQPLLPLHRLQIRAGHSACLCIGKMRCRRCCHICRRCCHILDAMLSYLSSSGNFQERYRSFMERSRANSQSQHQYKSLQIYGRCVAPSATSSSMSVC